MTQLDTGSLQQPQLGKATHALEISGDHTDPTSLFRGLFDLEALVGASTGPGSAYLLDRTTLGEATNGRRSVQRSFATPGGNRSRWYRSTKRLLDVVAAIAFLLILAPVFLATCALLTVTTKGRPFFCQTRYGLFGKPFTLYKFRTMVSDAEDLNHLIERDGPVFKKRGCSDPRVTRLGAFLRKTSIDELPQFFNVLLGQMSLVGPRPLSCEVERFESWQLERFSVRPGLTCLWQVKGRSEIGFDEWMRMDLWYVANQSLLTDAVLLLRTPATVLSCRGAG
jgi:lipopolysaccharide/colanic/teichoic acid biosynthesis glycosyltransferase